MLRTAPRRPLERTFERFCRTLHDFSEIVAEKTNRPAALSAVRPRARRMREQFAQGNAEGNPAILLLVMRAEETAGSVSRQRFFAGASAPGGLSHRNRRCSGRPAPNPPASRKAGRPGNRPPPPDKIRRRTAPPPKFYLYF